MSENEIIKEAWKIYYDYTKNAPIDLSIEMINDIYSRRLELSLDPFDKNDVIANKEKIVGYNGTIALPYSINQKHYILLAKKTITDNLKYIDTMFHELTHL